MVKTYFGTPVKRILITKLQETLLTLWHNLYLIFLLGSKNHKNESLELIWKIFFDFLQTSKRLFMYYVGTLRFLHATTFL